MFNQLKNDPPQQLNNLKLTNLLDNMTDPSVEESNKLQIESYQKRTKHMMRFFKKQSKNQG